MDISRWARGQTRPPARPEPAPAPALVEAFPQGVPQSDGWAGGLLEVDPPASEPSVEWTSPVMVFEPLAVPAIVPPRRMLSPEAWTDSSRSAEPEMIPAPSVSPEPISPVQGQDSAEPPMVTWPESLPEPEVISAPVPAAGPEVTDRPEAVAEPQVAASTAWTVDAGVAVVRPRSAAEVLETLAQKVSTGAVEQYQPVPLGFTPLDKTIGGGLRAGELMLIGGAQGTGKTTMAVQMARNIVLGGQASVLYVCFEHDEEYLLNRIIAMESVLSHLPQKTNGVKLQDVRKEILGTWLAQGSEQADLSANPRLRPALGRIARYGPNLYLLRGSQTHSTMENMHALVKRYKQLSGDRRLVVFIDYMQKVPVIPEPSSETEKITYIVQGMKDMALSMDVPLVSIVAADKEGLKAARLRNHHLRGSSAINYEADIILILNEKYNIVAKVNIEFNPYQAQRFRDWVICTIEKNRGGQHAIDLEYQKHFEFSCFDANGRTVQEKLIEERLYND